MAGWSCGRMSPFRPPSRGIATPLTYTRQHRIVSACTALVKSYGGLVACRFLLGITEAPVGDLKIGYVVQRLMRVYLVLSRRYLHAGIFLHTDW